MRQRTLVFAMTLVAITMASTAWRVLADDGAEPLPRSIVAGRLVGPEGQPLAGIPVYVAFADAKGYERPDQLVHFTEGPDSDGGRTPAKEFTHGHGVTGADGAFRLDATLTRLISSGDGRVRVVPCHPAWVESKRASGAEGGVVQAEPAVSLAVRVVDDAGTPIPELRAAVREPARRGDHGLLATHGGFVMQWRRGANLPAEVRASLVVWAPGRRIERRQVRIAADRDSDSITVDLGPVQLDGRLILRPVPALGSREGLKVTFSLALPERPDDEVHRVLAVWEPSDQGGAFVASLPPGRFRLRVVAWDELTQGPVSDGTIDVAPRETIEQTWETSSWLKTRVRR